MARRLRAADPSFAADLERLNAVRRGRGADVGGTVAGIVDAVRRRGDPALLEYTRRLDGFDASGAADLRIGRAEIARARAACDSVALEALELAAARIRAFHERQIPEGFALTDGQGVRLGLRWTALSAVGLYVPGGSAAYPSSVLMNAVPAAVAGVERVVMTVPAPGGDVAPLVLAAAGLAGVHEVYRVGGAQAVAALAFGTETIRPVDKITGPGNAYVAEAKRQLYGTVGIDMVAGPSEVVVVADGNSDPEWIAADLASQAEHDPAAQAILITDDPGFADSVEACMGDLVAGLPRSEIAARSWNDFGAVIVVDALADAAALVDAIAPEHLELSVADPRVLAERVRHAGAIFIGSHTPEAVGDYVAGPSHVLPTMGTARFASGLGVTDFMKRTTLVECDRDSLGRIGPAAEALAAAEGLDAHARSLSLRLGAAPGD